ncbi:MAG: hypothetical protein ACOYKD_02610 [Anaerolineaceae bacterium]|jgi:hypothetical protein
MKHKVTPLLLLAVVLILVLAMPQASARSEQPDGDGFSEVEELVFDEVSYGVDITNQPVIQGGDPGTTKLVIPAVVFQPRPHPEGTVDFYEKLRYGEGGCLSVDPDHVWLYAKDRPKLDAFIPLPGGTQIRGFEVNVFDENSTYQANISAALVRYRDDGNHTQNLLSMNYLDTYAGGTLRRYYPYDHVINATPGADYGYTLQVEFPSRPADIKICSISVIYDKPNIFALALPAIQN